MAKCFPDIHNPILGSITSKIRKFLIVYLLGYKNVSSLHVSVNNFVCVDKKQSFTHLLHNLLDFTQVELDIDVTEKPSQIMLTKVKYQIKSYFLPVMVSTNLQKIYNIFVIE